MLFITIYTFKPQNRDAVLARRAEGLFTPKGAKCLGQWTSAAGARTFTLSEVDDPLVLYQWTHAWSDLGSFEVYPVVDTEALLKAFAPKG